VQRRSLFLYWTLFYYAFRHNWPSSVYRYCGQGYNADFFPPIVVASGNFFVYVGCTCLIMVLFDLLVVALLSVLVAA
jgi:hypothetical protein